MKIQEKVINGNKKANKLGFPTANICLKKKHLNGVYKGKVFLANKKYLAAIFIGRDKKILEAHLLNFQGNLYNKIITVEIKEKIRSIKKFRDDDELKKQIKKDIQLILKSS